MLTTSPAATLIVTRPGQFSTDVLGGRAHCWVTASANGRHRSTPAQQVHDPDHACNYSRVPHLLLDDAADGKIGGSAITLYLHYKRLAFELHGDPLAESLRETKRRTGLSNGTILAARAQLVASGWADVSDQGDGAPVIVTLIERWEENCRGAALSSMNG